MVQSTEHALRAVDEAARKKFTTSSYSATEETAEEVLEPTVERTKIVISIQDKDGSKQYRVFAVCSNLFVIKLPSVYQLS